MNPGDALSELADRLIRRAAAMAPATLTERLQEEWLADMAARDSVISRLRFALGCCWAGKAIAHELGIPVRAAAAADKSAVVVVQHGLPHRSRGTTIFLLIIGLHVLVIYGLVSGLGTRVMQVLPMRTAVTMLTEPPARQPPTRLSAPTFTSVEIETPPPTWKPGETTSEIRVVPEDPGRPGIPALPPIRRVVGGPGQEFPVPADFYPAAAIRLGEQGPAVVQVCVDAAGRLIADPKLAQTSGSPRLDQGAIKLAKAGSGHYRPTTEDGRPVNSCYAFAIRFQLK